MKAVFFIFSILLSLSAHAEMVDLYLENAPGDYRVLTWNQGKKTVVPTGRVTRNYSVFKFSIPKEYVVKNSSGEIDVQASLTKWRKSTPAASGNPRTVKDIGYYPFTDEYGTTNYVALEHLRSNSSKYPNMTISETSSGTHSSTIIDSSTTPEVKKPVEGNQSEVEQAISARRNGQTSAQVLEKTNPNATAKKAAATPAANKGILDELKAIKANPGRLQCASNNGNSAHCMVCNCYYESRGESYSGQVAVNRTVITRTKRQGFPGSVCGVVWYKKRGTAAFSWTLQSAKSRGRNSSSVKRCVDATAEAVNLGSWQWDHFYNPSAASPSWGPAMKRKNGSKTYGNHIFLNSGSALKKTQGKTGTTSNKTRAQGGTE